MQEITQVIDKVIMSRINLEREVHIAIKNILKKLYKKKKEKLRQLFI